MRPINFIIFQNISRVAEEDSKTTQTLNDPDPFHAKGINTEAAGNVLQAVHGSFIPVKVDPETILT